MSNGISPFSVDISSVIFSFRLVFQIKNVGGKKGTDLSGSSMLNNWLVFIFFK